MKKKLGTIAAVLLCFILAAVSVYADDGREQDPDYVTDYYMTVLSANGGVNIYAEADPESNVLNDTLIVNGTAIHVQGEKDGTDNKDWAYSEYHGMNGYIPMDDLAPVTRAEAINKEFQTFGGEDVDFQVKIQSDSGNAPVYNGPGEKYGEISGGIADGTTVHISKYIKGEDGINWGKADTDGEESVWVNLDRDTDYVSDTEQTSPQESKDGKAVAEVTPTPEATPTPEVTPTPEATPTPEVTPTEEATPTPEATPTEEVTPTPEATPTEEVTPTTEPTPEEKKEETDKKPGADSDDSQKASGKNVKSDPGMRNPVIWISGIGIIIIIILLIYFLRKKK